MTTRSKATAPPKSAVRKPATARKRAAPRTPAAAAAPLPGVLELDRPENVEAIAALIADREPLFSIGGVQYTIPKVAPTAWTIKATKLATQVSELDAVDYAMGMMLGEEGYTALAECTTLTLADFARLRDVILGRVIPKGPKAS